MGTTALTFIFDKHNRPIVALLRTSNGKPIWHGRQLADYFGDWKVSNGLLGISHHSNGIGCFAATVVSTFKTEEGEFHLQSVLEPDDNDFTYNIWQDKESGSLWISIMKDANTPEHEPLYKGALSKLGKWLDNMYGENPFTITLSPLK